MLLVLSVADAAVAAGGAGQEHACSAAVLLPQGRPAPRLCLAAGLWNQQLPGSHRSALLASQLLPGMPVLPSTDCSHVFFVHMHILFGWLADCKDHALRRGS